MSFLLPTVTKGDSKCSNMGSRDTSLSIPNISANEKANLSSLSWGALQPSALLALYPGEPSVPLVSQNNR